MAVAVASPFEPKGDRSEATLLYELFASRDYGSLISYDELTDALGRDLRAGQRGPVYAARVRLEKNDDKTLALERCVGYRIARPDEHVGLAQGRRKRARKQLSRGLLTLRSTPRDRLDAESLARLDEIEGRMADLEYMARNDRRRVEKTVRRIEKTETSVADLISMLKEKGVLD